MQHGEQRGILPQPETALKVHINFLESWLRPQRVEDSPSAQYRVLAFLATEAAPLGFC